jgi:hypothetical protein
MGRHSLVLLLGDVEGDTHLQKYVRPRLYVISAPPELSSSYAVGCVESWQHMFNGVMDFIMNNASTAHG